MIKLFARMIDRVLVALGARNPTYVPGFFAQKVAAQHQAIYGDYCESHDMPSVCRKHYITERTLRRIVALVHSKEPALRFDTHGWRALADIDADKDRIIAAATELQNDPRMVLGWYYGHALPDFGNRTPEQLVTQGKAQTVLDYIESLKAGATG